jgi:hypothetical protein
MVTLEIYSSQLPLPAQYERPPLSCANIIVDARRNRIEEMVNFFMVI